MTDDLVAFLRARLDEDEAAALAATPGPWTHDPMKQWHDGEDFVTLTRGQEFVGYGGPSPFRGCVATTGMPSRAESMNNAAHIAVHDPARVLRDVEAKRSILTAHTPRAWFVTGANKCPVCTEAEDGAPHRFPATYPCPTLRHLAAVYADHPDYQEAWRP